MAWLMSVISVTARFMERKISMSIKIDEGFRRQIPSPSYEELAVLEQNLVISGGARDRLTVWRGYLVDGHNRFEICTRLGLHYDTAELDLPDREAVENWIDTNQLGRRNLSPDVASLLRGRIYNRVKKSEGTNQHTNRGRQSGGPSKTSDTFAIQYGVGSRTIERDGQFARAVDVVKEADAGIEGRIHQGDISRKSVIAAAKILSHPEGAKDPEVELAAAEVLRPKVPLATLESDPALSDSITLDAWNGMSPASRKKAMQRTSTSGFNAQDGDSIEWALWSWNPITGCNHNCPYCYARDIAERFRGTSGFPDGFDVAFRPGRLSAPQNQKYPEEKAAEWMGHKNVFTGSMADIFGKWVPAEWINAVLDSIRKSPQWNFLMLTKFPSRMSEFDLPDNVWAGTSVDCQARVANAEKAFAKVKAKVKWLSIEPMIEPVKFSSLEVFQWVVLGGASKSTQTPAWSPPREWVDEIEDQCRSRGVPYYEKSNLFTNSRRRGYPGAPVFDTSTASAPSELRYLPPKSQFNG